MNKINELIEAHNSKLEPKEEGKLEVECNKPHCRCMQINPCGNHHYSDCQPNWGKPAPTKPSEEEETFFVRATQEIREEIRKEIEGFKELHTHNSIPTYTDEIGNGCVICNDNQALDEILSLPSLNK